MNRRQFAALAGAFAIGPSAAIAEPSSPRIPTLLHIAWLRFKPEVSAARIEEHLAACRALPDRIPVLRNLVCGRNVTDRADGMTHGIVVTMRDLNALDEYLKHPEHVKVVTPLREDIAELRVMDLEL